MELWSENGSLVILPGFLVVITEEGVVAMIVVDANVANEVGSDIKEVVMLGEVD